MCRIGTVARPIRLIHFSLTTRSQESGDGVGSVRDGQLTEAHRLFLLGSVHCFLLPTRYASARRYAMGGVCVKVLYSLHEAPHGENIFFLPQMPQLGAA